METVKILRTDSLHKDFIQLVALLDKELHLRDGADHEFFKQFNKIDNLKFVVLAFLGEEAVSCGSIKHYLEDTVEVKRMFVRNDFRGQGIAGKVLAELETWAKELGYKCTILETGKRQPEAIRLYQKNGYRIIENYGQYVGVETSVCMTRQL